MEFTQAQVYSAFDMTPPEEQPVQSEAAAAEDAGAAVPESAEAAPAVPEGAADAAAGDAGAGQEADVGEDAGDAETPTDAGAAEKPEQTIEERRANAARRRQRETQAAIDAAVQEALRTERDRFKAEMDAFFAQANLKNTMTGAPITTMQEFREWKTAFEAAKLQRDLKAGKLTPEALQQVIDQTPAMQQVRQLVARQDEAVKRQEAEAARARVEAELLEIQKLDPAIKEVKDLLRMPNAREFYEYVKKGNTFLDAYYLANRTQLAAAAAEAARQQAMNSVRSKDHLSATSARGPGAAGVPAEELAMYREFLPNATEAEIQAHYNKYKGNQ